LSEQSTPWEPALLQTGLDVTRLLVLRTEIEAAKLILSQGQPLGLAIDFGLDRFEPLLAVLQFHQGTPIVDCVGNHQQATQHPQEDCGS
jgi:hypothetical protein